MKVRASNSQNGKNLHASKLKLGKFPELDTYFQSRHHMKTCWKESLILRKNWVNPGPFTCALALGAVRMMIDCPVIISRLRKKPDVFKSKILVKRWSNVQSDHPKQRFYMNFRETSSKYKGICIDFRLNTAKSDASARLTTVCHEFLIFLHRVFSWAEIWWPGNRATCARLPERTHT